MATPFDGGADVVAATPSARERSVVTPVEMRAAIKRRSRVGFMRLVLIASSVLIRAVPRTRETKIKTFSYL